MQVTTINTGSELVSQGSVHYKDAITPMMITSPQLVEVCNQYGFTGCFAEIKQGKSGRWWMVRGYDWILRCHPNPEGALNLCRKALELGYLDEADLPS